MAYKEGDQPAPGYMLTKFLGRGGFGEVWMANAPGGTHVAIKIINIGAKQGRKELRAIRLVKQVHHPNLVPITALWVKDMEGNLLDDVALDQALSETAGHTGGSIRDTMAFAEPAQRPAELIIAMGLGEKNLHDRLQECELEGVTGIPPEELLEYMEDSAKGIDYLNAPRHDLGGESLEAIQHCDIKPHNIMIVGGAAQVCDFGLARTISDTRATSMAGSPAYGAPECLTGNKPSATTDQYSLAISYYELRTGSLPFDDESFMGVINAHTQGRLNLSKLPDPERQVILRATSVDPEKRFDTTTKMVRALRRAYEGGVTENLAPIPITQSRPLPEAKELEPGMELVPGLKLAKRLVHSGIDEVWEAGSADGKRIALVIRDLIATKESVDRAAISLMHRIEHPHLTKLYAYWLLDNHWAVVPAEFGSPSGSGPIASKLVLSGRMAGKTLLQRLEELRAVGDDGIPFDELLVYITQIASAIDFLNTEKHMVGKNKVSIQHRNVRPINLVLDGRVAKLGNHSLVKTLQGEDAILSSDVSVIAHSFVAPELIQGRLTKWSDQYSLAVSIIQLRTGTLPFDAAHSTTQLLKTLEVGELDLSKLESAEQDVIRRATARVPRERFADCLEMIRALKSANQLTEAGSTLSPGVPDSQRAQPSEPEATEAERQTASETAVGTAEEEGDVTETRTLAEVGTKELTPPGEEVLDEDDVEPVVNLAETLDSGLLDMVADRLDAQPLNKPEKSGKPEQAEAAPAPPKPPPSEKPPAKPEKVKPERKGKSPRKSAMQTVADVDKTKPKRTPESGTKQPSPPSEIAARDVQAEPPEESGRELRGTMTTPLADERREELREKLETPLAPPTQTPAKPEGGLRGTLESPLVDQVREMQREKVETRLDEPAPPPEKPKPAPVAPAHPEIPPGPNLALIGWVAGGVVAVLLLIVTLIFSFSGGEKPPEPPIVKKETPEQPKKQPKVEPKKKEEPKKVETAPTFTSEDYRDLALKAYDAKEWDRVDTMLGLLVKSYTQERPESEENRAVRLALTLLAKTQTTPPDQWSVLEVAESLSALHSRQTDLMPILSDKRFQLAAPISQVADHVIAAILKQAKMQLAADPNESAATYRRLLDLLEVYMQPPQLAEVYLGRARALARKPAWQGVGLELASLGDLKGVRLAAQDKSIQSALALLVRQNSPGAEKLKPGEVLDAVAGLDLNHLDAATERVAIEQLRDSAIGDLFTTALAEVKKAKDAEALRQALVQLKKAYALDPQTRLEGLRATADTQYRLKLYGDFRKTLAEFADKVTDPKDKALLENQRMLSIALDKNATEAERKQIRTSLLQAVKQPDVTGRLEMCQALYTAAQSDEAFVLQAKAALEAAVPLIPAANKNDRDAIERLIAGLKSGADKKVKALVLTPTADAAKYFAQLKSLTENAGGEWGTVAQAEVSVETTPNLAAPALEAHRARLTTAANAPDAELKSYARYVLALLDNAEKQPLAAAGIINEVLANLPADAGLFTQVRATRCAQILATAAVQLASYPAPDNLLQLVLDNPLPANVADQAYNWLQLALKTEPGAVKNYKKALALAAWYKPKPDQETARQMTPELIEGQVADIDLPLLWIHARTRTDTEQEAGLSSYAELWRRLEPLAEKEGVETLQRLDQMLLSPALELAAGKPLQSNQSAAWLYAARGHLIWKHGFGPKDKNARDLEGLAAYDRAIALAGKQAPAEAYAGRAHFRIELNHALSELQPDILEAVQRDPQYTPLLGELGTRMVARAKTLAGKPQQAMFEDAIRYLSQALKATDPAPSDAERAEMLAQRSTAYLASTAAYSADADKVKQLLENAKDDADAAAKVTGAPETYLALGNVLLRLADSGQDSFNNYDAAANAFNQAAKGDNRIAALFGRGRARYQRWSAGDTRKDLLAQAITDLNDVVSQEADVPAHHYWLARALSAQQKWVQADESFAKAVDLAERASDMETAQKYQQTWLLNLQMGLAYATDPQRRTQIQKELLSLPSSPLQATLLSNTYLMEGNQQKVFDVTDAALRSVKKYTSAHVVLLLNRGSARVQIGEAATARDRLTKAVADADAAAEAADESTQALERGKAMFLASYCRSYLGQIKAAGRAPAPQTKIVEDLRKALEINKNSLPPESWNWRYLLARELGLFAASSTFTADQRMEWKKSALEQLEEAAKEQTADKPAVEKLQGEIEAIKVE